MNQADHIEKVINDYYSKLTKTNFSFEIIVVVNGTTDNSFNICQRIASKLSNVSVYNLDKGGFGLGILYGLKKAKGKYLCYLNCARVHADELIKCLKKYKQNPSNILHAIRVKRDILYRKISSLIYNTTNKILFNISTNDINGSPKIFSREIFNKLNLNFTNSMIDLELIDKAKKNNIKIIEFPIYKNKRHGGKSTSNFKTIFRLIREVTNYWYLTRIKIR